MSYYYEAKGPLRKQLLECVRELNEQQIERIDGDDRVHATIGSIDVGLSDGDVFDSVWANRTVEPSGICDQWSPELKA